MVGFVLPTGEALAAMSKEEALSDKSL